MDENYLLAQWLENDLSDDELQKQFSANDISIFSSIKNYSSQLETSKFNEQELLKNVLSNPKQKVVTLYNNWIFKVAAILVVSLSLYFSFLMFSNSTFEAKYGAETALVLPDQSEVLLNSGSTLSYKNWNWTDNRTLQLDGEAYFKVAKGKTFEVNTTQGKVIVLGTQFNVKQRENRFEVTCYEGKVKVSFKDKNVILTKGMKTILENGEIIETPELNINQPEWINKEMVFYQDDITNIIAEFERKYDVIIELNEKLSPQVFTGVIPADDLNVALEILTTTYHLKASRIANNKIILTSINVQK